MGRILEIYGKLIADDVFFSFLRPRLYVRSFRRSDSDILHMPASCFAITLGDLRHRQCDIRGGGGGGACVNAHLRKNICL